jgi:hypothetical protein
MGIERQRCLRTHQWSRSLRPTRRGFLLPSSPRAPPNSEGDASPPHRVQLTACEDVNRSTMSHRMPCRWQDLSVATFGTEPPALLSDGSLTCISPTALFFYRSFSKITKEFLYFILLEKNQNYLETQIGGENRKSKSKNPNLIKIGGPRGTA